MSNVTQGSTEMKLTTNAYTLMIDSDSDGLVEQQLIMSLSFGQGDLLAYVISAAAVDGGARLISAGSASHDDFEKIVVDALHEWTRGWITRDKRMAELKTLMPQI